MFADEVTRRSFLALGNVAETGVEAVENLYVIDIIRENKLTT